MKRNLLLSFVMVIALSNAYSQNVLNPGFENWTAGNPDDWATLNFPGGITITQSSDHHGGSWAARGEVLTSPPATYIPLLFTSGTYGFPMTQAFSTLEFWYKFTGVSGDLLQVEATVYDGANAATGIGLSYFGNAATYTHISMPVYYLNGNTPASCYIYFTVADTSTGGTATAGSFFLVDDLVMTNNPASVHPLSEGKELFNAFPNPAGNSVTLGYFLKENSEVTLSVFDVTGKKLISSSFRGNAGLHRDPLDLSMIKAGIYICRLETNQGIETRRIEILK